MAPSNLSFPDLDLFLALPNAVVLVFDLLDCDSDDLIQRAVLAQPYNSLVVSFPGSDLFFLIFLPKTHLF